MASSLRPSAVQLVYLSHPQWPLRVGASLSSRPLQIAILDSSFNPPTLAHLALANYPRPTYKTLDPYPGDYDAKLLLLSVRNADKSLKSGDATYEQRLEMMKELAQDVRTQRMSAGKSNVAIAMVDEPTFVGKSSLLVDFLGKRINELSLRTPTSEEPASASLVATGSNAVDFTAQKPKLTFLLGFDTLERLFAPRYYTSLPDKDSTEQMHDALYKFFAPEHDDSRVVCARRPPSSYPLAVNAQPREAGKLSSERDSVDSFLETIHDFLKKRSLSTEKVSIIDIGEDISLLSSTVVRQSIAHNEPTWKECVTDRVSRYLTNVGLYKSLEKK
jgi:nicotinamide-nucleotide adenylyltransferase